jgi:hypothetical protein
VARCAPGLLGWVKVIVRVVRVDVVSVNWASNLTVGVAASVVAVSVLAVVSCSGGHRITNSRVVRLSCRTSTSGTLV